MNNFLIAQVFIEDGFWTIANSDKADSPAEIFLNQQIAKKYSIQIESIVR